VGGDKVLPLLEKTLADQDWDVRYIAVDALGQVGGDKALVLLEKVLVYPYSETRCRAAAAVGKVGGAKARAVLLRRLASESNREVLQKLSEILRTHFSGDLTVEQALQKLETP